MIRADLHIHSKDCSDGRLTVSDILRHAGSISLKVISITDHDIVSCQESVKALAEELEIVAVTGVELGIRYSVTRDGKETRGPLDILGYGIDPSHGGLNELLKAMRQRREERIMEMIGLLNQMLIRDGYSPLDEVDLLGLKLTAGPSLGRPHLADLLASKGYVGSRKEAFSRYLGDLNLPKYPVGLREASEAIRSSGGKVVLAHPSDPSGTSLVKFFGTLKEQVRHIESLMLPYIDGIECWHTRHENAVSRYYNEFAKANGLLSTGGSDCHQNPIIMGSISIPEEALNRFLTAMGIHYAN